jgi:hypothetical protein
MTRSSRRAPVVLAAIFFVFFALGSLFITTARGGIRGPGKYSGVVVFDRWGTCFLLSGPYITYVSERVKDRLKPFEGMAVQVEASDVIQPENPGDALIRKYEIIGPAPEPKSITLDGLRLSVDADFGASNKATFVVEIHNDGNVPISVNSSQIGIALLWKSDVMPGDPSDGPSCAVITRTDLAQPSGGTREIAVGDIKHFWGYEVDEKTRLPRTFELDPGQSKTVRISFNLSAGQYQLMLGYGGGVHAEKSLSSNRVSFDCSGNDVATLVR